MSSSTAKKFKSPVEFTDFNRHGSHSVRRRETCGTHLVTGDAVVGVGGGGVVGAAVQRLLRRCAAAADVAAVQVAGVLQHRGAETHLTELVGGSHRLPGVRRLVVRRESCHVRLCDMYEKSHTLPHWLKILLYTWKNKMEINAQAAHHFGSTAVWEPQGVWSAPGERVRVGPAPPPPF